MVFFRGPAFFSSKKCFMNCKRDLVTFCVGLGRQLVGTNIGGAACSNVPWSLCCFSSSCDNKVGSIDHRVF